MTEKRILVCGEMVRAIQEGRKTQTRRIITSNNSFVDGQKNWRLFESLDWKSKNIRVDKGPSPAGNSGPYLHVPHKTDGTVHRVYSRYSLIDRLWVGEAFTCAMDNGNYLWDKHGEHKIIYRADGADIVCDDGDGGIKYNEDGSLASPWKPSSFMPRKYSRINLAVKNIRVERVQDISEDDAVAEGYPENNGLYKPEREVMSIAQVWYSQLWDSINGKGSWESNPMVWVIEFKEDGE